MERVFYIESAQQNMHLYAHRLHHDPLNPNLLSHLLLQTNREKGNPLRDFR